jgi:hypothetical protein
LCDLGFLAGFTGKAGVKALAQLFLDWVSEPFVFLAAVVCYCFIL